MKILYKIIVILLIFIQLESASCKEIKDATAGNLTAFATGLITPVCIANAGDNRLFVVNQHGLIMLVDLSGIVKPVPFLDISARVTFGGERGLLGIAFHPDYKSNGYFFVNYVGVNDSTHISRFRVSSTNPDMADPSSEYKLLTIYQPFVNHKGGDLCFGPDGFLYIGLGDGGSGGDPGNRAQNMMEYLGKILRIDVNQGTPYSIPPSNPYYNSTVARKEIWASGLRNPWRFSFDRLTGDLWIADVGQNLYEEVNFQPATSSGGENYGWKCYEGNAVYDTTGCRSSSSLTFPVFTYPHGPECAITGGFVNRNPASSPFYGYYFFSDYCSDNIWTLHNVSGNWVKEDFGSFPGNNFSTFGEDNSGKLYIAGLTSGTIYRINDQATGLTDNKFSDHLKVICIFGSNQVRIESGRTDGTEMKFTIYDATGVACYSSESKSSNYTFDISFLHKGFYLLSVVVNGQISCHKMIKG